MRKPEDSIIKTYYMISGLFTLSASIIWGINTLFLLNAGMTIFQVFVVNAVYSGSMAVFEIPTGVFADTLGRRLSFLFSTIVLMAGTLGYVFAATLSSNFWPFALMSVLLGLAYTFYSGAVEAWIVDALHHVGYAEPLDHVFSRAAGISSICVLVGTVLGGIIGTFNLSLPYIIRALLILAAFGVAFIRMKDLGYTRKAIRPGQIPAEMKKIARVSIVFGLGNISVRHLISISFLFSGFMMWGWYAWQPYFLKLYGDPSAIWAVGVFAALFALAQAAGSFSVTIFLKLFRKRSQLLIAAFGLQAASIIGVGLANSFYLSSILFLCFSFAFGLAMPVRQTYLHSLIPSENRASIVSFDSLAGSCGSTVGQIGYGYISEKMSIGSGYIISGLVHLLILPILVLLARRHDPEDQVVDPDSGPDPDSDYRSGKYF